MKWVKFEGLLPTQEYLDLLSTHLPNIESISCGHDRNESSVDNDAHQTSSFTFNLTALKRLKPFHINIEAVVDLERGPFDYLLFHVKYPGDDENLEAFYSIRGGENCRYDTYQLTIATRLFFMESSQNENLSTEALTFEFSHNIEKFQISCGEL